MLPVFPHFKKLEFSDRADVEAITLKYPPYSDFNFTSMWCWDTKNIICISTLKDNLIVRFTDYISGEPFYSFIGYQYVSEVADEILNLSLREGLKPELKLVPDIVATYLDTNKFFVEDDRDDFDYVYEIKKLATYDGNKLRSKRNLVNRYLKNYKTETKILDICSKEVQEQINNLFYVWIENKKFSMLETENEMRAISRMLQVENDKKYVNVGIYDGNALIGFIINELLPNGESLLHFEKADAKYVGVYSFLMEENAKILSKSGVVNLNYEQDLGIEGLRLAKKSYYPSFYLKKFRVSFNN